MPIGAKGGKKQQSERALRELRSRILSGELQADQHVSEPAAAEMLGISRTPAREAMARLVEEGLLHRSESGRCTVRHFTREDVNDAIEYRGVLEGTVLRLAAERGAAREAMEQCRRIVTEIDGCLGERPEDIDFDRYTALNADFHRYLAKLSGSPTMERELLRAHRLPLGSPNAFLQNQADVPMIRRSLFRAQAHHWAMLEAVANREGSRAEALAREHARLARTNLDHVFVGNRTLAKRIPGLSLVSENDKQTQKTTRLI